MVTITVTCYSWAPSSGDHLFSCGAISRLPHPSNMVKNSKTCPFVTSPRENPTLKSNNFFLFEPRRLAASIESLGSSLAVEAVELLTKMDQVINQKMRPLKGFERLCFRCFCSNHLIRDCKLTSDCSVESCNKRMSHHSLLHNSKPSPIGERVKESNRNGNCDCSTTETTMASEVSLFQSKVYLNVVPVVVRYGGQEVTVHAFLDCGSTASFCDRKLMEILQATRYP